MQAASLTYSPNLGFISRVRRRHTRLMGEFATRMHLYTLYGNVNISPEWKVLMKMEWVGGRETYNNAGGEHRQPSNCA